MDDFAGTCVFNKQSLGPILCGPLRLTTHWVHLTRAPLLPKLRGHFAEFLLRKSLEHLRLLASPTCVRLRYGHSKHSLTRLFLAVCSTTLCGARGPLRHRRSAAPGGFAYPETPTTLHRKSTTRRSLLLLRPPLRSNALRCGTGILTRFPSPTPFGLGLGTD